MIDWFFLYCLKRTRLLQNRRQLLLIHWEKVTKSKTMDIVNWTLVEYRWWIVTGVSVATETTNSVRVFDAKMLFDMGDLKVNIRAMSRSLSCSHRITYPPEIFGDIYYFLLYPSCLRPWPKILQKDPRSPRCRVKRMAIFSSELPVCFSTRWSSLSARLGRWVTSPLRPSSRSRLLDHETGKIGVWKPPLIPHL